MILGILSNKLVPCDPRSWRRPIFCRSRFWQASCLSLQSLARPLISWMSLLCHSRARLSSPCLAKVGHLVETCSSIFEPLYRRPAACRFCIRLQRHSQSRPCHRQKCVEEGGGPLPKEVLCTCWSGTRRQEPIH